MRDDFRAIGRESVEVREPVTALEDLALRVAVAVWSVDDDFVPFAIGRE